MPLIFQLLPNKSQWQTELLPTQEATLLQYQVQQNNSNHQSTQAKYTKLLRIDDMLTQNSVMHDIIPGIQQAHRAGSCRGDHWENMTR